MHTLGAISQVDGWTDIEKIQCAVVSKRHLAEIGISDAITAKAQTGAKRESAPTPCPVDIGIHTRFRTIEMIGP